MRHFSVTLKAGGTILARKRLYNFYCNKQSLCQGSLSSWGGGMLVFINASREESKVQLSTCSLYRECDLKNKKNPLDSPNEE